MMNDPRVSIIVAMDEKRGIGKRNKIPWYIPGELARFKEITMGHPIIMGRKTHESIAKTLPGRLNIVVTRDKKYKGAEGAVVAHSIEEALNKAKEEDNQEVFIIGGGEIYRQALSLADRLYLTLLPGDSGADVFFPEYSEFKNVIKEEEHEVPELREGYKYKFLILER